MSHLASINIIKFLSNFGKSIAAVVDTVSLPVADTGDNDDSDDSYGNSHTEADDQT